MTEPGTPSSHPPGLGVPGSVRFSVIDLETSGLSPARHRILQVADVSLGTDGIVDEWSSLVGLRRRFGRVGPRRIHGISRSMLRGAPDLGTVVAHLFSRIDGTVVVGHNIDFDWSFLHRAADLTGHRLPDVALLCTLRLSRSLDPDHRWSHRLGEVGARYGIANERPHDALHDARTTALVLPHLLAAHHVADADDLRQLYLVR